MSKSIFVVVLLVVAGVVVLIMNIPNSDPRQAPTFAGTEFEAEIMDSEQVVIVDFTATWCGPCKQLKPLLEQVESEGLAKVVEIDVDRHSRLKNDFGVVGIPHLLFLKNGKPYGKLVGYQPIENLKRGISDTEKMAAQDAARTNSSQP